MRMTPDSELNRIANEIMKVLNLNYEGDTYRKLFAYLKEKLTPLLEFNSSLSETWNNEEDEVCWRVTKEDL